MKYNVCSNSFKAIPVVSKKTLLFGLLTTTAFLGSSQISEGGLPYSFMAIEGESVVLAQTGYQVHELIAPDMHAVRAEDASFAEKGRPYRVGINIPVSYSIHNSGTWEQLPSGDRIWRLGIRIPGAQALSLYFSEELTVPAGGKLHAYNEKRSQFIGAYTANTPAFYAMEMVQGDLITLEYFMPAGSTELPVIVISEVAYYYRGVESGIAVFRDGEQISEERTHGSCEVDAMCSEADDWYDERRSTVRYTFTAGGTFLCTASVINNTAEDCTPYILTANHCGEPNATSDFNNHVWYFNYQRPACNVGNTGHYSGALSQTMSGGIFRASSTLGTHPGTDPEVDGCDFVLAELEEPIPTFYHAYYAGWNRNITPVPQSGVCFHHPAGDEKKISTYTTPLVAATYNGGWSGAHWQVEWADTPNGWGVTEGGSSGSSLLDQDGRIVGHLSGGSSFCSAPDDPDLYGKFHRAWDLDGTTASSQLKSWLDPGNTNVLTLDGTYGSCGQVSLTVNENVGVNIYPNPTNGLFTVSLGSMAADVESVQVYDVTGRVLFTTTDISTEIILNLMDEVPGVYYVRINTPSLVITRKIVRM
jgi:lysyl endopeptidase